MTGQHLKRIVLLVLALAAVSLPALMVYYVVLGGASPWLIMIDWAGFHVGMLLVAVASAWCFSYLGRRGST